MMSILIIIIINIIINVIIDRVRISNKFSKITKIIP
jgi:hypothetical protein